MYTMESSPPLSSQRAAILAYCRRELSAGRVPSLADVASHFGFASRNAARKHVQALLADGLLEQAPDRKRSLQLPGGPADLLPLAVLGRVAAGQPIGADIGLDAAPADRLWFDRRLFSPTPDYLLKVQGDSMLDDGILDGDLVGVHRTADARDGQTVIARIDGELTIKRLRRERHRIRLLPRNPAHGPIDIEAGQDFAIEGVYCGLVRQG